LWLLSKVQEDEGAPGCNWNWLQADLAGLELVDLSGEGCAFEPAVQIV
jgi:hypothetical protein